MTIRTDIPIQQHDTPITPLSPIKLEQHRTSLLQPGVVDSSSADKTDVVVITDTAPFHLHPRPSMLGATPMIVLEEETIPTQSSPRMTATSISSVKVTTTTTHNDGPDPTIGMYRPNDRTSVIETTLKQRHSAGGE